MKTPRQLLLLLPLLLLLLQQHGNSHVPDFRQQQQHAVCQ
jgi:hypothetical protein